MVLETITFASSAGAAFWLHEHFEKRLKTKYQDIRLKIKGYHIHHSCFGITAILIAIFFANGILMLLFLGYGTGNLWQHKITHNRVNEKGLVFISRLISQNSRDKDNV